MSIRRRVIHRDFEGDVVVRQEPASQTDINEIIRRAKAGESPQWINQRQPVFGDVSELPKDLTSAYSQIERAEEAFYALPAKFRQALDNDPRNLLIAPQELFAEHGLTLTPDDASEPVQGAPRPSKKAGKTQPDGVGSKGAKAPDIDQNDQD